MPSDTQSAPRLNAQQVCFVVEDVSAAVDYCQKRFGWGPFYQFTAPVPDASYQGWQGEKITEVALGMAGQVQVEFLHIHKGHDTTADYQDKYGQGFQHIGIRCKSREAALSHLEALGATVNERNEYPGVEFAFVNVPTGPGMFEILQSTARMDADTKLSAARESQGETLLDIDRATIVTHDIDQALTFYSGSFGWENALHSTETLRYNNKQTSLKRYVGSAGKLALELIQPIEQSDDPYARHLARGDHGLIHAGGAMRSNIPGGETVRCEWLETGECFSLYDWAGGTQALQIRMG